MKKTKFICLLTWFIIIMLCSPTYGGGWGPYFSWGRESPKTKFPAELVDSSIDPEDPDLESIKNFLNEMELNKTTDHLTFGALYESAPSQDRLFNYRFALGFDLATNTKLDEIDYSASGLTSAEENLLTGDMEKASTYGLTMQYTFAVSPLRFRLLKWWIGPGLRINANYYNINSAIEGQASAKALSLCFGGGIDTGINFHLGSIASLSVSGGFHWTGYGYGKSDDSLDTVQFGDGPYYFIQTALLFHTKTDKHVWNSKY